MSAWLSALGELHFLRPWWLAAMLGLPVAGWWWRRRTRHGGGWQNAVDAHLLPHLLAGEGARSRRQWGGWLGLLGAALALLAMAGPSFRKAEQPLWQARAPLVIALDLSTATLTRDLPPTRLAQARAKIATLLRERAGGQVALVAYADDAYTVAPLTDDAANLALFLDALAPDLMPVDGRRADRAIAWSQRLLANAGFGHGDILLLTGEADAAAIGAAGAAHASGYRVSALGLGTEQGGVFDTPTGLGRARLDPAGLRRLAASGGGAFRPLVPGDADLRALGVLDPGAVGRSGGSREKVGSWRDEGYWLLPLAMLLLLPLFRRGAATAAVLSLALLLPMPRAQAQAAPVRDSGGLWRRADQQAYSRMQEGVAAYRQKQFEEAIGKFSGNPTADGQYNLGNALAKAGRYDEAIAAYDRALELKPGMRDAMRNRAAVAAERKRKPPPGGGDRQQQDRGRQGQDDPRQQDRPGDAQDRRQQGQRQQPTQPQPPASAAPQDAQQQAQADAAQRQRMQEALRRQQGRQQADAGAPQQQETPAQRERRIANQAQLQRVPDDPGALLRARFRLEHERRRGGGQ